MTDINSPDWPFDPNAEEPPTADQLMEQAMVTYRERNKVYGSSYHKHGRVMAALYPEGLTLATVHEFNLQGCLNMIISKVCRLSQSPDHRDSIHDIGVYAFMYEELLALREAQMEGLSRVADILIPFAVKPGYQGKVPDMISLDELVHFQDIGAVERTGPFNIAEGAE